MARRYSAAEMLTQYDGEDEFEGRCEVMFHGNQLAVTYEHEAYGRICYIGEMSERNVFALTDTKTGGKVELTLHDDGETLKGRFVEGTEAGTWLIYLGNQD